jgi:hypothetical protein
VGDAYRTLEIGRLNHGAPNDKGETAAAVELPPWEDIRLSKDWHDRENFPPPWSAAAGLERTVDS